MDLDLDPVRFNIKTVPARVERQGDLFRPAAQELFPTIEAFQRSCQK